VREAVPYVHVPCAAARVPYAPVLDARVPAPVPVPAHAHALPQKQRVRAHARGSDQTLPALRMPGSFGYALAHCVSGQRMVDYYECVARVRMDPYEHMGYCAGLKRAPLTCPKAKKMELDAEDAADAVVRVSESAGMVEEKD